MVFSVGGPPTQRIEMRSPAPSSLRAPTPAATRRWRRPAGRAGFDRVASSDRLNQTPARRIGSGVEPTGERNVERGGALDGVLRRIVLDEREPRIGGSIDDDAVFTGVQIDALAPKHRHGHLIRTALVLREFGAGAGEVGGG